MVSTITFKVLAKDFSQDLFDHLMGGPGASTKFFQDWTDEMTELRGEGYPTANFSGPPLRFFTDEMEHQTGIVVTPYGDDDHPLSYSFRHRVVYYTIENFADDEDAIWYRLKYLK